jgi:hypothetical protein
VKGADSARKLVVVAGSGRSGTSLFAGLGSRLGLYIPQPEVASNRSNPKGFSEPRWAVDFNEALLKRTSVSIDDARPEAWGIAAQVADDAQLRAELGAWLAEQFEISDRVIVKDPRLVWFLDLYRAVADSLGAQVVIASLLRDPAEVLRSRQIAYGDKRHAVSRAAGWVNLMLTSEHITRRDTRVIVRYEHMLADWRKTMTTADDSLRLDLFARATPEQVSDADALVDTSLRRSVSTLEELGIRGVVADLTQRTHDTLAELAAGPADPSVLLERLDVLRDEYARMHDDAVAVAQSTIGAARREVRANTTARVRREMTEARVSRPLWGRVRSRAARVLRRTGA